MTNYKRHSKYCIQRPEYIHVPSISSELIINSFSFYVFKCKNIKCILISCVMRGAVTIALWAVKVQTLDWGQWRDRYWLWHHYFCMLNPIDMPKKKELQGHSHGEWLNYHIQGNIFFWDTVDVTAVKSIVYSFRSTRETLDTVLFTIRKFVLP